MNCKKIIPIHKLEKMGFIPEYPKKIEAEFSYDVHCFYKNGSCIEVTTEYHLEGKPVYQYVEFNEQTLEGDKIGVRQLYFLMRLL
jgi:hypothetical protein